MNELTVQGTLLEKAAKLNRVSQVADVILGMVLVKIKDERVYEPTYKTFPEYYAAELGRVKSDISKLLTLGRKLLGAGFTEETAPDVGYSKLYVALSIFPDKPVEYAIAEAQSNTIAAMLENRRDDALEKGHECSWEPALHCTDPLCGRFTRNLENS